MTCQGSLYLCIWCLSVQCVCVCVCACSQVWGHDLVMANPLSSLFVPVQHACMPTSMGSRPDNSASSAVAQCLFSVCAYTQVWGHELVMAPPPSSGAAVMLALHILQGKVCTPSLSHQPSAYKHPHQARFPLPALPRCPRPSGVALPTLCS